MKSTPNYNLVKQELTDVADITQISQNWDKIDTELNRQKTVDEDLTTEIARVDAASADLDTDGRLKADQMRFDSEQTIYVNASVATSGDGSEASPFKTIQEAINGRYRGASTIYVRVAAGTYNEEIVVPPSPNTAWNFTGSGTVNVKSINVDICSYVSIQNFIFNPNSGTAGIRLYNVGEAVVLNNTINATENGVSVARSRALISGNTINNAAHAVYAVDGTSCVCVGNSGIGNAYAFISDAAVIHLHGNNTISATKSFSKSNGGAINPATWYSVTDGTSSINDLNSGIYTVKNGTVAQGLPLSGGGTLVVDISTNYPHMIFYADNVNKIYHRYHLGGGVWSSWVEYYPQASASTFGLLRVASTEDELDCTCEEAAITPANFYSLADFRLANTEYNVGDRVECKYNFEYYLECTKAGTSSSDVLDTHNETPNQVITDGTMEWTVKVKPKSVNGIEADTYGNVVDRIQVSIKDRDPTKPTYGL